MACMRRPPPGTVQRRVGEVGAQRAQGKGKARSAGPNDNAAASTERTISTVKIRAVTFGFDLPRPEVEIAPFESAAAFLRTARSSFEDVGIDVQTLRCAGPSLDGALNDDFARWCAATETAAHQAGIEYLSLGRVPASAHEFVADGLASILARGEIAFLSCD